MAGGRCTWDDRKHTQIDNHKKMFKRGILIRENISAISLKMKILFLFFLFKYL